MSNVVGLRVPFATSTVVVLCLVLGAIPQTGSLAFDRQAILAGEVWRLWSGHLVHFSPQQLFWDVGTLFLAGAIAEKEFGARVTTLVVWLGMPAIAIGLLVVAPDLAYYRGASGVVMLLAFAASVAIWRRQPNLRVVLVLLGLVLAVKATLDVVGVGSDMSGLPDGVKVAWQAHVLGAGIGWAFARLKLKNLQ